MTTTESAKTTELDERPDDWTIGSAYWCGRFTAFFIIHFVFWAATVLLFRLIADVDLGIALRAAAGMALWSAIDGMASPYDGPAALSSRMRWGATRAVAMGALCFLVVRYWVGIDVVFSVSFTVSFGVFILAEALWKSRPRERDRAEAA